MPEDFEAVLQDEPGRLARRRCETEWKVAQDQWNDESSSEKFLGMSCRSKRSPSLMVLGWLLLRRADLSASSRLSVQASVNNSLSSPTRAGTSRPREEELLQADLQRGHPMDDAGPTGLSQKPIMAEGVFGFTVRRCRLLKGPLFAFLRLGGANPRNLPPSLPRAGSSLRRRPCPQVQSRQEPLLGSVKWNHVDLPIM